MRELNAQEVDAVSGGAGPLISYALTGFGGAVAGRYLFDPVLNAAENIAVQAMRNEAARHSSTTVRIGRSGAF